MASTNRSRGSSRQRMVDSTVVLLREQGAGATTIDAVLAHSGAPRGSVYHHFPGGRHELIAAAVIRAGDLVSGLIRDAVADGDAVAVLRRFAELWRSQLVATDFRAGCPVLAVAVGEGAVDTDLGALVSEVLHRWRDDLSAGLAGLGIDAARGRTLATFVLAAIEGAVVLCRTEGSAEPLDASVAELEGLLRAEIGRSSTSVTRPDDPA